MTSSFHLWRWFEMVQQGKATGKRFDAEVILKSSDHKKNHVRFKLSRSVPTKIKAPPFNAKDGLLAIEEMQIAYERLSFQIDDSSQAQTE
jgi:phage tail-like protein